MQTPPNQRIFSYFAVTTLIVLSLYFQMIPSILLGMVLFLIIRRLERHLDHYLKIKNNGRIVAVGVIITSLVILVTGFGFGVLSLLDGPFGASWLAQKTAESLEQARQNLPPWIVDKLPQSVFEIQQEALNWIKQNGNVLSGAGIQSLHVLAHLFLGGMVGVFLAVQDFSEPEKMKPLQIELLRRFQILMESFRKISVAQVKISAINTLLTGVYLLIILPKFGVEIPLVKSALFFTFFVGLIPVFGNLCSNVFIVLLSAGHTIWVGVASLVFLVIIHKLEYFLNAKIIGQSTQNSSWELLLSMLILEIIFGIQGLIAAPILYTYLKAELQKANLI